VDPKDRGALTKLTHTVRNRDSRKEEENDLSTLQILLIYDSSGSIKPSNIRSLRRSLKDMNAENVAVMKKP